MYCRHIMLTEIVVWYFAADGGAGVVEGEKYACEPCEMEFVREACYEKHIATSGHIKRAALFKGELPEEFKCSYPGCSKIFLT